MRYDDHLDEAELRAYTHALNARARRLKVGGRLTVALLRTRIYESRGRCEWCDVSLVGQPFEVDHILNLSRGGTNVPANLAISCPDCNRRKAGRHPASFASEQVARTGVITPLIRRVLDHYDIPPRVQRSLFDDDPPPADPADASDADLDDIPPYRW